MMEMNNLSIFRLISLGVLAVGLVGCFAGSEAGPNPTPAELVEATHEPPALISQEGIVGYYQIKLDDTLLDYAVVLPENFQAGQTYPILLAMPPGEQNKRLADYALENYWAAEAHRRGWVVLSPLAPQGKRFFDGSESLIPGFLARTAEQYPSEGGKYHLGGVSNGGLSAFRLAVTHPELFHSVLVLPGLPYSEEDFQNLERLKDIPVAMFAGEKEDEAWLKRIQATEEALTKLGGQVSLEIVPGDGHDITSLNGGEKLFDLLESFRPSKE
jgi:predicted peptidase